MIYTAFGIDISNIPKKSEELIKTLGIFTKDLPC